MDAIVFRDSALHRTPGLPIQTGTVWIEILSFAGHRKFLAAQKNLTLLARAAWQGKPTI